MRPTSLDKTHEDSLRFQPRRWLLVASIGQSPVKVSKAVREVKES